MVDTSKHTRYDEMPEPGTRAHETLLAVIEYIRQQGRVDLSFRQLAEGAGTSHRMLGYYFGTREQMLGLVMRQLSAEYIANSGQERPKSRVEAIERTWSMFRDPNNRLQTQLLFVLSSAAAEKPDVEIPALNYDLDNFATALTMLGQKEGLDDARAAREGRLIIATLLGLYLDYFITRGSPQVDESFRALVEWITASSESVAG